MPGEMRAAPHGPPHEDVGRTPTHQGAVVARVIVREARSGPDPAYVTEDGGQVLDEFDSDRIYDLGEPLSLPDGTEVKGIAFRETFAGEHMQTVMIGNLP